MCKYIAFWSEEIAEKRTDIAHWSKEFADIRTDIDCTFTEIDNWKPMR